MNRPTLAMRQLAERLIAAKRTGPTPSEGTTTSFPILERLHPALAALVGTVGVNALMARAIALTTPAAPWLRGLQVTADGALQGLGDFEAKVTPEQVREGRTALLTQLLGLLRRFIGDHLTVQMLREVWPTLSLKELEEGNGIGDDHETGS